MTFWLDPVWQTGAAQQIESTLNKLHADLYGQGHNSGRWTQGVLHTLVPTACELCSGRIGRVVCGLKGPPDGECKGEWLYDFCCWIEDDAAGEGFLGMPIIAESEWGKWHDIWDDFDKLTQARAGLRVLVFQHYPNDTPEDWKSVLLARARKFLPRDDTDAWLLACWTPSGFEFASTV
jgi:hypothetical protein